MARSADSGKIDLAEVFRRVQREMLAQLDLAGLFEHPSASGAASEQQWLDLFDRYLPKRYRAAPAFVVDSLGRRSRQIDIAIFDQLHSPPLFPHSAGVHIPAESVYAVFEVKPTFSRQFLRDAHLKAASVPNQRPILSGLLATRSVWPQATFASNLQSALGSIGHSLDLGCCLDLGSFECSARSIHISHPEESLIFFILRLLERLNSLGPAPSADWNLYGRGLQSFQQ